jgi:hypothetical protein
MTSSNEGVAIVIVVLTIVGLAFGVLLWRCVRRSHGSHSSTTSSDYAEDPPSYIEPTRKPVSKTKKPKPPRPTVFEAR